MQQHAPSQHPPAGVRHWLRRELPQLALLLLLLGATRDSFANHYVVPSGSMQHSLQVGDRVAVDMRAYGLRLPFTAMTLLATGAPARGDIALFDSPQDGVRLIKRVAAVAGDRVDLQDGRLSINGVPMAVLEGVDSEAFGQHLAALDLSHGGGPDIQGLVVPAHRVLMLGDARGNSIDGRFFGLVPAEALYGRALVVYYRRGEGLQWRRL